jgi:beta-lactamase regulating signal transducer with metallopeptidase domain
MLNALAWNLLLTAVLAIALAAMCRSRWLARRPALRHWLWLLLLAKLVTPPLVALPLLPADLDSSNAAATASSANPRRLGNASAGDRRAASPGNAAKTTSLAANDTELAKVRRETSAPQPTTNQPGQVAYVPRDSEVGSPHRNTFASLASQLRHRPLFLAGLLAVSLLGTCVALAFHTFNAIKVHKWLKRAGRPSPLLTKTCIDVAAQLHIRRGVRCCVVDARTTPLLWGWHRPMVVMPRELLHGLGSRELRGIVAHELAHLARRDHWANAFALLVKAFAWWNPVVWWADVELRAAQELCCDAIAIGSCSADRRG